MRNDGSRSTPNPLLEGTAPGTVSTAATSLASLRLPLRSERLDLERPSARRVDAIARMIGDRRVSRWLLHVPHPYRREHGLEFIRRTRQGLRDGTDLALTSVDRDSGEVIGGVGLHAINGIHRRAELGYWVGRPHWRQGYASEGVARLLATAFGELRLHRVYAHTYPGNAPSAGLLLKLGFRDEGRLRESVRHWGRWEDERCFGLTVSDYRRASRSPRKGASRARRPVV